MTKFNPREDTHWIWRWCGCAVPWKCMACSFGIFALLAGGLLLIILLALSIHDVDENEIALEYNIWTKKVSDPIGAGKHTLSVNPTLFRYDRRFITNDLQLRCITKDGLLVDLKVNQQYRINPDQLKTILFEFGKQSTLDQYIDTISQDSIRDVCAQFTGEEFFSRRGEVELTMISNMTQAVIDARSHVLPGAIQLVNIVLPKEFLESIRDKQLASEAVDVAENERVQRLIEIQTKQKEAELDAKILIVNAEAKGNATKVTAQERANARLLQWLERTKAFLIDLEALGVDPETYVDKYLFPRLRAQTLTPQQQACLQTCPPNTACWFCFRDVNPAVIV